MPGLELDRKQALESLIQASKCAQLKLDGVLRGASDREKQTAKT